MITIPFSTKYTIGSRYDIQILKRESHENDKFYPSDDYIYIGVWDFQDQEYAAIYDLDSTLDGKERIVTGYVMFDRDTASEMEKFEHWSTGNFDEVVRVRKKRHGQEEKYRRITVEEVLNSQLGAEAYFDEGKDKILEWLIHTTI